MIVWWWGCGAVAQGTVPKTNWFTQHCTHHFSSCFFIKQKHRDQEQNLQLLQQLHHLKFHHRHRIQTANQGRKIGEDTQQRTAGQWLNLQHLQEDCSVCFWAVCSSHGDIQWPGHDSDRTCSVCWMNPEWEFNGTPYWYELYMVGVTADFVCLNEKCPM